MCISTLLNANRSEFKLHAYRPTVGVCIPCSDVIYYYMLHLGLVADKQAVGCNHCIHVITAFH